MLRLTLVALALAGCAQPPAEDGIPTYLGVQTSLLEGDLVGFDVALRGAATADAVETYAKCAAAQYTLIRGYSFARLVRTNVTQQGGTWRADAVKQGQWPCHQSLAQGGGGEAGLGLFKGHDIGRRRGVIDVG